MEEDQISLDVQPDALDLISEEEFRDNVLNPFARPLLSLVAHHETVLNQGKAPRLYPMNFLARIIKDASDVENLLDRYDASKNLKWIWLRKYTASLKNFSKAAFLLEEIHWSSRFSAMCPGLPNFKRESEPLREFFVHSISGFFKLLGEEALLLGLDLSEGSSYLPTYGVKIVTGRRLPHTIEQAPHWDSNAEQIARRIAYRFVELADMDARLVQKVVEEEGSLIWIYAPMHLDEKVTRKLATAVHNLLSWYDTFLKGHSIEQEFSSLPALRNIFSCLLSLLKISTILLHYFERHLLGWPPAAAKLRETVPPQELVDEIVFQVLLWTASVFRFGKERASELLKIFVETATYELPVPKDMGFHARPSTLVARIVRHYGAEVRMLVDDQVFNAGNIMEMLSAGGYIVTKGLDTVQFRGDKNALDDLRILAKANYGETRDGKGAPLPKKLRYLQEVKARDGNGKTQR